MFVPPPNHFGPHLCEFQLIALHSYTLWPDCTQTHLCRTQIPLGAICGLLAARFRSCERHVDPHSHHYSVARDLVRIKHRPSRPHHQPPNQGEILSTWNPGMVVGFQVLDPLAGFNLNTSALPPSTTRHFAPPNNPHRIRGNRALSMGRSGAP